VFTSTSNFKPHANGCFLTRVSFGGQLRQPQGSWSVHTCMLFTFENGVSLMRWGASVMWHHSLLLMNNFNKNRGCCFLVQAMLPEGFPFHQFNLERSVQYLTYKKNEENIFITNKIKKIKTFPLSLLMWIDLTFFEILILTLITLLSL